MLLSVSLQLDRPTTHTVCSHNSNGLNCHKQNTHQVDGMEGEYLTQQPSFDMDHDYGFFEMEDLGDTKDMSGNHVLDEDDRSRNEPSKLLSLSIVEQLSLDNDPWECLFSSSRDGPSFRMFLRHVRGHARTILIAKAKDGPIYGAYTTHPWSGHGRKVEYGNDASFLFQFPSTWKNGRNLRLLNSKCMEGGTLCSCTKNE